MQRHHDYRQRHADGLVTARIMADALMRPADAADRPAVGKDGEVVLDAAAADRGRAEGEPESQQSCDSPEHAFQRVSHWSTFLPMVSEGKKARGAP